MTFCLTVGSRQFSKTYISVSTEGSTCRLRQTIRAADCRCCLRKQDSQRISNQCTIGFAPSRMYQEVFDLSRVLFVPLRKVAGSRCYCCTVNTPTIIGNILQMEISFVEELANLLFHDKGIWSILRKLTLGLFLNDKRTRYISTSGYLRHLNLAYSCAVWSWPFINPERCFRAQIRWES